MQIAGEIRIYPQKADMGKLYDGSCISGMMAQGAKIPKSLNGKRVTAYGTLMAKSELEEMISRGVTMGVENYCNSANVALLSRIVEAKLP